MAREAAHQGNSIPTLASGASFSTFSSLEDQYPPELLESHHLVEARVQMPNVPPTLDGDRTVVASPHRLSVSLPPPFGFGEGDGVGVVQSPEKMDTFASQQQQGGSGMEVEVSMEDMPALEGPGSTALSGSMEDMPAPEGLGSRSMEDMDMPVREDSMEAVSGHVHITANVEADVDVSLVTHATADSASTRDEEDQDEEEEANTTGRATAGSQQLDVQDALQALLSTSASSVYDVEDSSVEEDEQDGEDGDEEEYTEFWMPSFAMDTPAEAPEVEVVNVPPSGSFDIAASPLPPPAADSSSVLTSLAGPPSLVTLPAVDEDEHLPVAPQLRPSIEVVLDKAEADGFPFLTSPAPAPTISSSSHPLTLDVPSVAIPQSPPPEVVASPFVLPSSSPALGVPEVSVVPASPLEEPQEKGAYENDKSSTTPVPPSPHSFNTGTGTGVEPTPSLSSTDATIPDRPTSPVTRRSGTLDVEGYVVGTSSPAVHFPSSASAVGAEGNGNGMVLPVRGRAKSSGEKHKGSSCVSPGTRADGLMIV